MFLVVNYNSSTISNLNNYRPISVLNYLMIDAPEHNHEPSNISEETTDTSSLEEETEADEPAEKDNQVIIK